MKMKALVFNASPNMEKGNTALILNPFIEGMKEEGAEAELLYVRELKVNPCQGEQSCWIRTPGRCLQDGDMQDVYPKLQQADIVVFATPVYVDGMTGALKNLVDRLIPTIQPYTDCEKATAVTPCATATSMRRQC